MKKRTNTTYERMLTIEVRNKQIVQIAGKCNSQISPRDSEIIKLWAKESELIWIGPHI